MGDKTDALWFAALTGTATDAQADKARQSSPCYSWSLHFIYTFVLASDTCLVLGLFIFWDSINFLSVKPNKGHGYTCWFTPVYYSLVADCEWGQTDNWVLSMSSNNGIRFIMIFLFLLYNSVVWINEENHITFKTSLIGCVVSSISFLKLPAIWHWEQVCQDNCWANSNLPKQMEIQQGDMEKLSDDLSPRYLSGLWSLSFSL